MVKKYRIKSVSAERHYIQKLEKFLWWTYWTSVRERHDDWDGTMVIAICKSTVQEAKQWIEERLYQDQLDRNAQMELKLNYPRVIEYP